MPSSNPSLIPTISKWIWTLNPNSILDVGCGFGRYGFLCRDILDICKGRYKKSEWGVKIDGIEIFKYYITPMHEYLYDEIIIGDIRKDEIGNYDLIILGDVIEHIEKEEGLRLVSRLLRKCKWMIIQTPHGFMKQGTVFGNPNEEHISSWYPEDFNEYYPQIEINNNIFVVLLRGK